MHTPTRVAVRHATARRLVYVALMMVVVGALTVPVAMAAPRGADLSVVMYDFPDPASLASELSYSIVVKNAGPQDASGVTMTDELPAGTELVRANSNQGTCGGTSTVTCLIGSVSKGATVNVSIEVRPRVTGILTNRATVTADHPDPKTANNTAVATTTVEAPTAGADLSIELDGPSNPGRGMPTTYHVRVTNWGPKPATDVRAEVVFDNGYVALDGVYGIPIVASAVPSQGSCFLTPTVEVGGIVRWPTSIWPAVTGSSTASCSVGSLAVEATATVRIDMVASASQTVDAYVAGAQPDPDARNDHAQG